MNRIYTFLIFAVIFSSCKKDNSISTAGNLVGHWKLEYQAGGLSGAKVYTNAATNFLILNSDKTYQRLTGNTVQQQGTYQLGSVKSIFTGNNDKALTFDASGLWKIIAVQKDTLSLADNFADGYNSVYVRIK